jgi:hypothetical protein
MAMLNAPATDGDKREVGDLKELVMLLKAGSLSQGVTASPALLEELEERRKEPTTEEAIALFAAIEKKFPHNTLGEDKWYLVAVSPHELRSKDLS